MYYDQLRSYMHFSRTATPWLHLSGYNPLACLPSSPGSGGQQVASYTRMQRPRKHQPLPYRTGLDPRLLLAAVVCLPQERGEVPKPFYQEAEIQAAFLSASPAGIDQETYGDRNPPNQGYPMAEDTSSEAILSGVYPCASPLSTTNDSDLDSDQAGGLNSSLPDSESVLPAAEGLPATSSSPEIPPPIHSSVPAAAEDPSVGIHASPDLESPAAPSGDEPRDTGAAISSVEETEDDGEDDVSTPEPKSSKKHLIRGSEGIGSEEMPNLIKQWHTP